MTSRSEHTSANRRAIEGSPSHLGPLSEEIILGMLNTPIQRPNLIMQHPLFSQGVILPTLPINEIYQQIRRSVYIRESGRCFKAPSGSGKSFCIDMICDLLKHDFPNLAVIKIQAQTQMVASIRSFFKHILTSLRHNDIRGETYDLKRRAMNRLVDEAKRHGMSFVVLFIDEAQCMRTEDYYFLKDVSNGLSTEGVQLVTVLFGQAPEFEYAINDLRSAGKLDIVSRFTMRLEDFRPFSTLADIEQLFEQIEKATYPAHTNISWIQFLSPKSYAAGFRFKNEARPFFEALTSLNIDDESPFFPARSMFLALRHALFDFAVSESVQLQIPPSAWVNAIQYAQVIEAARIGGMPQDSKWEVKK
ncbi:MAG: ATP-binding protein [Pseudomonadota bacterium]